MYAIIKIEVFRGVDMFYQIAIDGPAGAGKSTIAKEVAKRLGFTYIDTGAMYRAVALKALRLGINLQNEEEYSFLDTTSITIDGGKIFLDGEDVSKKIRSLDVSNAASIVAKFQTVRTKLVDIQRELAKSRNVIMDGRDIGTVVLHNATLKIFLNASVEERAKRRMQERNQDLANKEDLAATILEIKERDYMDSTRSISPLRKAEDAIEIDTSSMSIPEVIDKIISLCAKRGISMDNLKTKDSEQLVQEVTVEQENVQPEATVEVATVDDAATEKPKRRTRKKKTTETVEEKVANETSVQVEVPEQSVLTNLSTPSDQIDDEVDIDHDISDDDIHDDEDDTLVASSNKPRVKPLQLVTGTVVRVFDPIETQIDNFGNVIRKARDARVLFTLDNGLEGLLYPRDMYNYSPDKNLHELFPIGHDFPLIVKKVYPDGGRVLLSTTLLKLREDLSQFEEIVKDPITTVLRAKVIKKLSIGLLLKYKEFSCLLPTSQIVKREGDINQLIGQEIDVAPIRIDYNRIRLVVSETVARAIKIRQAKEEVLNKLEVGQVFEGVVRNIEKYGAFVQIAPGIEGLLHISEISHDRVYNIEKVLKPGDTVKVQIINLENGRIGLSMKSLIPNYWKELIDSLKIGDLIKGKVTEINKAGVVIGFEHGVNGFLPKSEFAWEKEVHIEDYISVGDELELKVIELDLSKKRIILSRKQLQDNPWEKIKVKQNDWIDVVVTKVLPEGFKVTYEGVMGYIAKANIDEKIMKVSDIKEGTKIHGRVTVFDPINTRLFLSMFERPTYNFKNKGGNTNRFASQEVFTNTIGDLLKEKYEK